MALEGIRVVGPSGGRERRRRRSPRDEAEERKPFDDALKQKLDAPEADEAAEIEISEDGTEEPPRPRTASRWWRHQKGIDFTV
jgi:hypothetical protein